MATVREITVSFKGTIPTQAYGGIAVELSWQADLDPDDNPEQISRDLFAQVRGEVIKAVLPVAQAKAANIDRALQKLPTAQRDTIKANLGPIQWLYAVMPQAALADKDVKTTAVEGFVRQPQPTTNGRNDPGAAKGPSSEKARPP